ncbi:hypothetical protein Tco_0150079 [Tanacetum coccineum]
MPHDSRRRIRRGRRWEVSMRIKHKKVLFIKFGVFLDIVTDMVVAAAVVKVEDSNGYFSANVEFVHVNMSDEGYRSCPLCAEEMLLTEQQLKHCDICYEKLEANSGGWIRFQTDWKWFISFLGHQEKKFKSASLFSVILHRRDADGGIVTELENPYAVSVFSDSSSEGC